MVGVQGSVKWTKLLHGGPCRVSDHKIPSCGTDADQHVQCVDLVGGPVDLPDEQTFKQIITDAVGFHIPLLIRNFTKMADEINYQQPAADGHEAVVTVPFL